MLGLPLKCPGLHFVFYLFFVCIFFVFFFVFLQILDTWSAPECFWLQFFVCYLFFFVFFFVFFVLFFVCFRVCIFIFLLIFSDCLSLRVITLEGPCTPKSSSRTLCEVARLWMGG